MRKIKLPLYLISLIPLGYILKGIFPFDLTLMLYIALYGIAFYKLTVEKNKLTFYRIDLLFYLWAVILMLGVIYAPNNSAAMFKTAKFIFLALPLIYFSRLFIKNQENMVQLINYLLVNSTLTGYLVLIDFFTSGVEAVRYLAFGEIIPIPLAMLGATTTLISVFMYYFNKIKFRDFALTLFPSVGLMGIAASKGPVIGMIVAFVLMLPLFFKKINIKFAIKTGFIIAIITRIPFVQRTLNELFRRFSVADQDLSTVIRIDIYQDAINSFKQNPLLGTGTYGNYPNYPHNFFLEILSENGAILFVVVFILVVLLIQQYVIFLKSKKNSYIEVIIFSLLFVSLGSLMFSFTYVDHKYLFLSIGMLVTYKKTIKENEVTSTVRTEEKTRKKYK